MKRVRDSKKLMLVDDDGLVLATFGKDLKDSGYEVRMADSAEEGLRIIASEPPPDLAILDISMPGMSGLEMAQMLRMINIPWMFLSAYDDETYVNQAAEEGALGYLIKPLDVTRAIPTIETALHRARDLLVHDETEKRLNSALETGNQVNVVIGVLMERNKLNRQDAYELLRRKARSEQKKVKKVAEDFLTAWENINALT